MQNQNFNLNFQNQIHNQNQFQPNRISVKLSKEERGYFSNLFQMLVKEGELKIEGKDGANFLKKSGLPKETLKNIWTLSAQTNLSWLERDEFYIALRLVALAQNNYPVDSQSIIINEPIPPLPKFDLKEKEDWEISNEMLNQYINAYETYKDKNSQLVNIQNANEIFLFYKAKKEIIQKIYEIISFKRPTEGFTKNEIIVIMHLLNKSNNNYTIPNRLPDNLKKLILEDNSSQNFNPNLNSLASSNLFTNSNQQIGNSYIINNNSKNELIVNSDNQLNNNFLLQPIQSNISRGNNYDLTNNNITSPTLVVNDNCKIPNIVNTQLNNCITSKKEVVVNLQNTFEFEQNIYNNIKSQVDLFLNEGYELDKEIFNLKKQIQDVRKEINISADKLKMVVIDNNKKYKEINDLNSKFIILFKL